MMHYDYLVIGGGSGGIASARRAAEFGVKVAVIESDRLGGTCVNVGCVPKKVMWYAASLAEHAHLANDYDMNLNSPAFAWTSLKNKRDAYIKRLNGIYANNLDNSKVDIIRGKAQFKDANTVIVNGNEYHSEHIMIATGGYPVIPKIPGAEYGIDSDGFFELDKRPEKVAIIGAGYIATELAGVLNGLGSQVTQILRRERILMNFDEDIATTVQQHMAQSGVTFLANSPPSSIEKTADKLQVLSNEQSLGDFDCVIWATGRAPNTHGLNLEAAGVQLSAKGHIVVDEYQNTSAKSIFSVGDVTGAMELTPVAIAAGRKLAHRLFNNETSLKQDYTNIPTVIFSHPPIATIGLSEKQAIEAHGADQIKVYKAEFTNMIHAFSEQKTPTVFKLIVTGENEKIIGCHLCGDSVDEMMQGFAVAIKMGATKADFDATVAIHPTASEELVTMR